MMDDHGLHFNQEVKSTYCAIRENAGLLTTSLSFDLPLNVLNLWWAISELNTTISVYQNVSDCKETIFKLCSIAMPEEVTITCAWHDAQCPDVGLYVVTLLTEGNVTVQKTYTTKQSVEFSGVSIYVGVPYFVRVE